MGQYSSNDLTMKSYKLKICVWLFFTKLFCQLEINLFLVGDKYGDKVFY